ncbi:MAG: hypothetical protein H8E12_15340 [Rhodobacteraceae bacterium]|nr:hypothetical protein [Paracoccaceae bacterium]
MPFFKDTETNAIVFYPKLYNNKYMNGEIDPIEDFDKCVAVVNGAVVGEGYPEDLYDDPHDMLFLKED